MFDQTRAFDAGELYRLEILRVSQSPFLVDDCESAALLSQSDLIRATAASVFQAHELGGLVGLVAQYLSKAEARSMVEAESSPLFIIGLRKRRYREFLNYLKNQSSMARDVMRRRTNIAYRSHEWGIWLGQSGKYLRMWMILGKLYGQATIYRMGFEADPEKNLQRLADLFCHQPPSDA